MIRREEQVDILALKRLGYSERRIGRMLGLHRRTVKRYLESGVIPVPGIMSRGSKLDPYKGLINGWLKQDDYQATKIHELLTGEGFRGSYEIVKRYVSRQKEERDRVAYVRFETLPGQQAQVDFGEFAVVFPDGVEIKLYCFVMALGFSRHMYVEFVDRCTMSVFLDCHIHAFNHFGGVPGEILYDNMKNVVVRRLVGKVQFNERMMDFAAHYQFKPVACPAYSPWCKGKVERPMDYIRERFWRGYVYWNMEKANRDVLNWVNTVAYERVHGTTKQKVSERFEVERPRLGDIPRRPYDTADKYIRKVQKDCLISFGGNWYIMSHKCVGKKLVVRVKDGILRAYDDAELITEWPLGKAKGELLGDRRFYEELRNDQEQLRRKYRKPAGKGKATIGLKKFDNYNVDVQVRDMSAYENIANGGASCQN